MNNYQNALAETNLSENQLTKKLQSDVNDHKLAISELLQLRASYQDMDGSEDNYEELGQEIEELEEALVESDEVLCEDITKYAAKKPSMDEKIKRMQEGNARKRAEVQGNPPAAAPVSIAAPKIVVAQAQNNPAPTPVAQPQTKKETSFGEWIFWGVLGIAGFFVGARIIKNK